MSLLLCGCGGRPLSEREIVRGILFTRQNENYSVCLVLANQQEEKGGTGQNKIVAAQGRTPAQALEQAEESLYGDVYYGLLDLVAFPSDTDWSLAQEIGTLLYDNAQPAPELSVFLLGSQPVDSWADSADRLYNGMKSIERTYKIHCGLQQLFTQNNVCAIPAYTETGGYDYVILAQDATPLHCSGVTEAQLAAVLCGQTDRLQGSYNSGNAACTARAQVLMEDGVVQLHLRHVELKSLSPQEKPLQTVLTKELQRSFATLYEALKETGTDPFHMIFWQNVQGVSVSSSQAPTFEVVFE